MYTISGGRRLYKHENGGYNPIEKDEVFESQTISIFIEPMMANKDSKKYIEKVLSFNEGDGSYKLINSIPKMELIFIRLAIATIIIRFLTILLLFRIGFKIINISFEVFIVIGVIWISLNIAMLICRKKISVNYDQYMMELNNLRVIKED